MGKRRRTDTNNPLPSHISKFWNQRYTLFSKFDDGIQLNEELWYSVTPEEMAMYLAKFFRHIFPDARTILDICSGGGGNTIQFARYFPNSKIFGIDNTRANIDCAVVNSAVYNVESRITYLLRDWENYHLFINELKERIGPVDVAFCSPPWGGPSYLSQEVYDSENIKPLGLERLLESMFQLTENVVLFLPRNTDKTQLSDVTRKLKGPSAKCRVVEAYVNKRPKGILCFWGEKFTNYQPNKDLTDEED
ncbi:hypothetical protein LJB42_000835 [Komagataella kurtzmanii]|nr:hypothetical protein LJB42_000835 [Komagataella kurtzmanii]